MIERLELQSFKAFSRFTVTFGEQAFLVGPNSAGKSTVIAALRTAGQMLRYAQRRQVDYDGNDGGRVVPAYSFSGGQFQLVEENLRHEFRDSETRLSVRYKGGSELTAVWPPGTEADDEAENFFYLKTGEGVLVRRAVQARNYFPSVTVLPLLAPVDHQEKVLDDAYVWDTRNTRLASRHFRNLLRVMGERHGESEDSSELEDFLAWAQPWTPDFVIGDLSVRQGEQGRLLDVFCREFGSRTEKELFWAGDGIQVWSELLAYLYMARDADTIVLDEPDLYLHADLQRRLVRLLESMDCQTIAASHSAEVLVEASPRAVVWISKDRRRAVRAPTDAVLSDLSSAIGSQFNLRLARALRSKAVLFVEGQDSRILRNFALTLGAQEMVKETNLITISLGGYTNWEHVEPFKWLTESLLEGAVKVLVVLDRDYRSEPQVNAVTKRLSAIGIEGHVWRRKELESYVLDPVTIARVSGASAPAVQAQLELIAESFRETVFARQLAERLRVEVGSDRSPVTVTEDAQSDFAAAWKQVEERPYMCNAKDVIRALNSWLDDQGCKTISARNLAYRMRRDEIPDEMASVIMLSEEMAS